MSGARVSLVIACLLLLTAACGRTPLAAPTTPSLPATAPTSLR